MVRASTRSKTAASLGAAKVKASTSKKPAAVQKEKQPSPPSEPPATPIKASKPKPTPKLKVERKPTRSSPRKAERAASEPHPVEEASDEVPPTEPVASEAEEKAPTPEPVTEDQTTGGDTQEQAKTDDEAKTVAVDGDGVAQTWCICHGTDDGTPMIVCDCCNNWYVDWWHETACVSNRSLSSVVQVPLRLRVANRLGR